MEMIKSYYMAYGPIAAGAATTTALILMPMPDALAGVIGIVPGMVWAGGAGYIATPPSDDQMCGALKGMAGGMAASMLIRTVL